MHSNENTVIIAPENSVFSFGLKRLFQYRDLIFLLVKREIKSKYAQTVLGPLWFFIQPLFTAFTFYIVFNKVAQISTGNIPPFLFYLAGITLWNYFAETLTATASTFITYQHIFGKVYFPRLVVPLSIVFANLFKFFIQFGLFVIVCVYYTVFNAVEIPFHQWIMFPFIILSIIAASFSVGLIITAFTTRYRDLQYVLVFGIQILMFVTPVFYSAGNVSGKIQQFIGFNPLTPIFEISRYLLLSEGYLSLSQSLSSAAILLICLLFGIYSFNKVEKSFIDTV